MTGPGGRDFEPPPRRPAAEPPWELQAGHDLEDVYCVYTEWQVMLTRGLPDVEVARLRDMAGWSADKLRGIGVDSALLDRFEEYLSALPGMDDFPARPDEEWLAVRLRVSQDVERLLNAARAAIAPHRARYYDYGVMLCRIRLCLRMLRIMAKVPAEALEALPDIVPLYRRELLRVTAVIMALVAHEGPDLPHDPEQHDLDREFAAFAEYVSSWWAEDAEPPPELPERLDTLLEAAGFRKGGDSFKQDMTWREHAAPVPETERLPLPVPHSDEEREQLASYMNEIRSIAGRGEMERAVELVRDLLAICRSVLGPVHPLTLHVQVDFAAMRAAVGEAAMATMMLLDIAHTAQHYYGPYHPVRYLVCAHAHSYLRDLWPEAAQEIYDFPLKSLAEREEAELPATLHPARRTIREALGMEGEPA